MQTNKDYTTVVKPPDSEVKPAPTRTLSAGRRIPAAELKRMVDHILEGNCHISDTDEYINKLFPTDQDLVDRILTKLQDSQVYDRDRKRWSAMPTRNSGSKPAEVEYYDPFVDIAREIADSCQDERDNNFNIIWLDRHKKAPQSNYTNASLIRPDILALLLTHKSNTEWDQLIEGDEETDEQLKHAMAWWLRVHIPVEIKPHEDPDIRKHVNQLLMYMRQVLKEQVNRQFVYGLLLSDNVLSIWLLDRSGVFGTAQSFNIHKDPKKFIQVIAGCSVLAPQKMGWDTTMRLCKLPLSSLPTTFDIMDPEVGTEAGEQLLYDTRWAIEMPSQADKSKRELFITLRALSLARTDDVPGRSTVVWAAVKACDLNKPAPHKIYVLKQSWRPNDGTSEGDFYEISKGVDNVGRCYSYEDVCIDGNTVTTDSYIRCNLSSVYPPPLPPPPPPRLPQGRPPSRQETSEPTSSNTSQSKKRSADALDVTESLEPYSHVVAEYDSYNIFTSGRTDVYPRTFFRLVLEDFGWSVKYFLDLRELLEVFKDTISAHKNLLFDNKDSKGRKLLHRDISAGNILICPNANGKFNGRLIDLDYAKFTTKLRESSLQQFKDTQPSRETQVSLQLFQVIGYNVPNAFAALALQNSFAHMHYLDTLLQAKPALKLTGDLSISDLGFLNETQVPDFSVRKASGGPRSATLPFASPEVLTTQAIFPTKPSMRRPLASETHHLRDQSIHVHDAVHDIEAFFWVLNYLCITREGCTGQRRSELQHGAATENNMRLRVINYYFFSSQDAAELAHNKRTMFTRDDYVSEMQPHFHPYFEPLKELLSQWWNILLFAHQYPLEAIHDWVLHEVDVALGRLEKSVDGMSVSEGSEAVEETPMLKKRHEELAAFQDLVTKLTADSDQNVTSVLSLSPHKGDKPNGPDYTGASYTEALPDQDPPSSPTPQYKRAKRS